MDKIIELEERIKRLEEILSRISFTEAKEITMTSCPIGDVHVGENSHIDFKCCPIGSVIDSRIDDADSLIDDLESRLDEIDDRIGEAESKIEELDDNK